MTSRASPADSVDAATRAHVVAWLQRVEAEAGVRVLYAAESGSRAWGFASPDSDYDVRFIYAHPRDWYTSLVEARDVIERPLDERLVDLAGWDVRKALRLALRSNPAFYEWLVSPIVYGDDGRFAAAARAFFEAHANPITLAHHYHSIARTQWQTRLEREGEIKLKRYFYCLRPLLSLAYVLERGRMPPMSIGELMASADLPADVQAAITDLVERKRSTPELGFGPRIPRIDAWIAERLAAFTAPAERAEGERSAAVAAADDLFRTTVGL